MTTIYELIREVIVTNPDDDAAAWEVINMATTREQLADLVHPLVAERVTDERRSAVRRVERRVFDPARSARSGRSAGSTTTVTTAERVDPVTDRAEWLKARIWLDDGRRPTWGEATAEDHEARAAYLARMRDGLSRTIDQHLLAAKLIRKFDATCLLDLDDETLAEMFPGIEP